MTTTLRVDEEDDGARLDVFVARRSDVSRSAAAGLIDAGDVTVDGRVERRSYRLATGEAVVVAEREPERYDPPPGVEVVHEDDAIVVVSKPPGIVTHAAPGLREGTLVDALRAGGRPLAPRAGDDRPGIVHRLDRDVSGLLVVAKTDEAHEALVGAMARREIERRYIALVAPAPEVDLGKIDAPVGRDPKHRSRMATIPEGRPAVTWFEVTERLGDAAFLDVRLETGRTHQIRTHLASIGCPVVGDAAYGRDPALARRLGLQRPFLHARRLVFDHPTTGERMAFERELPADLVAASSTLRS